MARSSFPVRNTACLLTIQPEKRAWATATNTRLALSLPIRTLTSALLLHYFTTSLLHYFTTSLLQHSTTPLPHNNCYKEPPQHPQHAALPHSPMTLQYTPRSACCCHWPAVQHHCHYHYHSLTATTTTTTTNTTTLPHDTKTPPTLQQTPTRQQR